MHPLPRRLSTRRLDPRRDAAVSITECACLRAQSGAVRIGRLPGWWRCALDKNRPKLRYKGTAGQPTTNEPEPDAAWHRSHRNRPEAAHPSRTARAWQGWTGKKGVLLGPRDGQDRGTRQQPTQPSPAPSPGQSQVPGPRANRRSPSLGPAVSRTPPGKGNGLVACALCVWLP